MPKASGGGIALAAFLALLAVGLGGRPATAHNDWGLPLLGGLVGGYALKSVMHGEKEKEAPRASAPPPATPAPAPASSASTAASVEHQLNLLDELAAKGYITQSEYQAHRQALLSSL